MNKNRYSFRCSDDEADTSIEIDVTTDKVSDIVDYLNRFLTACGHANLRVQETKFSSDSIVVNTGLINLDFSPTSPFITLNS